jgi:hypothetical protein
VSRICGHESVAEAAHHHVGQILDVDVKLLRITVGIDLGQMPSDYFEIVFHVPQSGWSLLRKHRFPVYIMLAQPASTGRPETSSTDKAAEQRREPARATSGGGGGGKIAAQGDIAQPNTQPTHSGERVSQGLSGVRGVAQEKGEERFTALLQHVTVDLLRESFQALKKNAAPGVDGVTWREYEKGLDDRLNDLHSRVHRGAYQAQPSRRVYIPKADGRQRPLGIAALEDKVVQHAVVTVLNQIYEVDFVGFS